MSRAGITLVQPVQSAGTWSSEGPRAWLLLCCCGLEILKNYEEVATPRLHVALGPANYILGPDKNPCLILGRWDAF